MTDSDVFFRKGVDMYNIWYKFIDTDHYNSKAYDYFMIAKTKFIIEKNNEKTKECFDWMIKCISSNKNSYLISNNGKMYEEYAELLLYKLKNETEAIKYYKMAIEHYSNNSNLHAIIKIKEKLGDYYKSNSEYQKSIEIYSDVTSIYPEMNYSYTKTQKILYELYVSIKDFEKAYGVYDSLLNNDKNQKFLQSDYAFGAMLNYIIFDREMAESKYKQYCSKISSFSNDRKGKFINDIISSLDYNEPDNFDKYVNNYDEINKLNSIEKILLSEIKNMMYDEMSLL